MMYDPDGVVAIDNLYFGPPIPAPGAIGILAVGLFMHRGSRRRSS